MQGIQRHNFHSDHSFQLEHSTASANSSATSLSIEEEESAELRIRRLITEHPVVIFTRPSCCMCHVMKNLLTTIGVHPAVIELDDHEVAALDEVTPSVFIGGASIGGLDSLVGLHLSGRLVPRLVEVGALPIMA